MTEQQKDTEQLILNAARKVFIEKGLDGARMQEIADEAGINKSLLHYYFRGKEKLFEMIFQEEIGKFFPQMVTLMASPEVSFEDKIRTFVGNYISVFIKNPFLAPFILKEIHRNPENIRQYFIRAGINVEHVKFGIGMLGQQLNMSFEEARHFIINMISLCIFPFAGRPLIEKLLFQEDKAIYEQFLEERKKMVAEFIINALKNRNI
ncbi:MAG: TetR/AcrR family transcriptional regulator [Bacteroidales bacterium]|nr:MAG: TetR/AcrR family transcriptional regulator [Bacteroidales bacterium]